MKLFALHSPKFAPFWEPFRKSVLEKTSFTLVESEIPSRFDGCCYGQPIYYELLRWLVEWRVGLINSETEIFATSGVDTEFFGDPVADLYERMQDHDLLGADDSPGINDNPRIKGPSKLCSCLYVIRPCSAMVDLYKKLLTDPRIGKDADDPVLNEIRDMVRWAALPHNLYWNPFSWFTPKKCWVVGDPVPVPPKEMLWFHANFCIGFPAKLAMLKEVKRKYLERR